MDLQALLPRLLPHAITWAEAIAGRSCFKRISVRCVKPVGCKDHRRSAIREYPCLDGRSPPLPSDAELRAAAQQTGLLGPEMTGLTLGYSILICHGQMSRRLLSHECRHVFQYEQAWVNRIVSPTVSGFNRSGWVLGLPV